MSPAPLTPLFYISAIKYRESLKAKDSLIAHLFRRIQELETELEKQKENMEPKLKKSPASSEPLNLDLIRSSAGEAGGHYNENEGLELPYPRKLASVGNRDQERTLSKPLQSSQHRPHFSKHNFLDLGSLNQNRAVPSRLPTVAVTKVKGHKLSNESELLDCPAVGTVVNFKDTSVAESVSDAASEDADKSSADEDRDDTMNDERLVKSDMDQADKEKQELKVTEKKPPKKSVRKSREEFGTNAAERIKCSFSSRERKQAQHFVAPYLGTKKKRTPVIAPGKGDKLSDIRTKPSKSKGKAKPKPKNKPATTKTPSKGKVQEVQSSQHRLHFSKHHFLDLGSLNQNRAIPSRLPTVAVTTVKEPKLSKAPTDTTEEVTPSLVLAKANPTLISSIKRVAIREPKTTAEKCMVANPRLNCMTTESPYFVNESENTMSGRQVQEEEELVGKNVEVPAWRFKIYEPLIRPQNDVEIEDLSEQAFLKRHRPLEIAEKRRKHWDSQRIREETYVQKLKRKGQERERKGNIRKTAGRTQRVAARSGDHRESAEMDFERPNFDQVMYIRVSDDIPISVFGSLLPISEQSTFQIPWKTKLEQENSSPTIVPYLRDLGKPSSETNHSSPSASQIVMTGRRGGYSISSSSSASQSSEIKEMRRFENPALDLDEAEPTCLAPMNFAMSADRGNPSK